MSNVAVLPTQANAEAAWERYATLVRQLADQPDLRLVLEHNIAMAKAWDEWRDLYLAWDKKC